MYCVVASILITMLPVCESIFYSEMKPGHFAILSAQAQAEVEASVHDRVLHSNAYGKLATLTLEYFWQHFDSGSKLDEILILFDKAFEFADQLEQEVEMAAWHRSRGNLYLLSDWVYEAEMDALQCLVIMAKHNNHDDPDRIAYKCNVILARVYQMRNRLEDASFYFQEALSIVHVGGRAFKGLVAVDRQMRRKNFPSIFFRDVEALIRVGERMLVLANFDPLGYFSDRVDLHFTLFLLHHERKNRPDAWYHVSLGNRLAVHLLPPYDPKSLRYKLTSTKTVFDDKFFKGFAGLGGHPSAAPVFIVGMMQSGSSLVEQILRSHSRVLGMGEDSIFNGMLPQVREALVAGATAGVHAVQAAQAKFGSEIVTKMLRKSALQLQRSGICHPGVYPGSEAEERKCRDVARVRRVVDKYLFNHWNVGFIHFLYPNARIIHVTRDPMDTVASMYQHRFDSAGLAWAANLGHLVREYAFYRKIMRHWDKTLPGRVYRVPYASLVSDKREEVSRRLLEHIGLEWEPDILGSRQDMVMVRTHSHKIDSRGSWRQYHKELRHYYKKLVKALGGKKHYAW